MANANATSSSHTQGPWTFTLVPPEFCDHNEMFRISSPEAEFPDIADVFARDTDEEALANAWLIAASPDQNEALRQMVDAIEEMLDADDLMIDSNVGDLLLQIATIGNKAIVKSEVR